MTPDEWEQLIALVAAEVIERMGAVLQVPHLEPGTVEQYAKDDNVSGARAVVSLDTDVVGVAGPHSMAVLVSAALTPGQRVMTYWDPPQAPYVIGVMAQNTNPCRVAHYEFDGVIVPIGEVADPLPLLDYPAASESLSCGFELQENPPGHEIVILESGVYLVGGRLRTSGTIGDFYSWGIDAGGVQLSGQHRLDSDSGPGGVVNTTPSGHQAVYLAEGDTISGNIEMPTNNVTDVAVDGGGITVVQLCCDFAPTEFEDGGGPES